MRRGIWGRGNMNIDVAVLSICKELSEISGWGDTYWNYSRSSHYKDTEPEHPFVLGHRGSVETQELKERYPAYDLGYLLRKLPERTENIRDTVLLGRATDNKVWSIVYQDLCCIADTPENAAAELAIKLFKQGILKKEG